jgi:hypothetical protein
MEIAWRSCGEADEHKFNRAALSVEAALNCKYTFPHFLATVFGALIRLARAGAPV